jgi:hypothetical protein
MFIDKFAKRLGVPNYVGVWDANTNTPTITSGVGQKGSYYIVSVGGSTNINGETNWSPKDWIVFNGISWEKIDNSEPIKTVANKTGDVVLDKNDVGLGNVDNTPDSSKPVSSAQQVAINKAAYYYAIVL